jgi:glycosyltransferase involved in cell wall biosynthesis
MVMKKALMMASVASMIDLFNMDNIEILKDLGYEVEVACNFEYGSITSQDRVDEFKEELIRDNFKVHHLPVPRSVFAIRDIVKSYKMMKKLCDENNYEIVHCHSPIGGIVARLACRKARKKGTKVIYTAHGFHFFKGAPLKNWLVYYTAERITAKFTDSLITINKEDYENAQKFNVENTEYVPGIGIDVDKIKNVKIDRSKKRSEFNLSEDDFVLFTAGQLSKRKNHEVVIKALAKIENKNVKLLICGLGELENYLKELIHDLGLENRVILAGYRNDVVEQLHAADCFVFPSFQEGLPVALMEAMAVGLPVVCSKIRGNVDLIEHGINGFLVDPENSNDFARYIEKIISDETIQAEMSKKNLEYVKKYDKKNIRQNMIAIYNGATV